MQIIKDKQIIRDTWSYVAEYCHLPDGDICVSLPRWQAERESLLNHDGKLGLRITSDVSVAEIAADLDHFALIELDFPAFTDGRGFTQTWLLRNRYHFTGEIRAVGHFMRDQLFYLQRVGVNAFKLENTNKLEDALALLNDFSVTYQTSTC